MAQSSFKGLQSPFESGGHQVEGGFDFGRRIAARQTRPDEFFARVSSKSS
jgi:hypothetical protein